ncbi:hypothetical protein [Streptomyces sp. NPDC059010]|uniref:hypothetical protein n=1 Tax=Streptomyces sp. NPDC059010 TaxID=3346695 RepID=UPI0036C340E4
MPSGATEDRNCDGTNGYLNGKWWRLPSGVTEDRNTKVAPNDVPTAFVAVALRGD